MDSIKLRRLAGIPIDLSQVENAKKTVKAPAKLAEQAKVPQHRGELAPMTKDNMRARHAGAKKALEALEQARDALMDLPAVDYMEDIPTIIKQLHQILHGEDGTGGLHHLHRKYKQEFDNKIFPEDIEDDKRKAEEAEQAEAAGTTNEAFNLAAVEKKAANPAPESASKSDGLGFEKQKVDPAKENKKPFKLAPGSDAKTMYQRKADEASVEEDPRDNTKTDDKVYEDIDAKAKEAAKDMAKKELGKNPFAGGKKEKSEEEEKSGIKPEAKAAAKDVAKKELGKNPFEQEEDSDEEDCAMSTPVAEATGTPLFARDALHPKHKSEERYSSWGDSNKPVNAVSAEDGPSLYYPEGSKSENANQLSTNPYNESQKVNVPAKIKAALKTEAETARKLAETFTLRKDWDSKVFHETLANAMETLGAFLDKGTVYGIKEAQVFMTSLMSPFTNKLPAEVIKFVAAGGSLRSLKSYVNDVKEPVTSPTVFQQDSNGVKQVSEAKNHMGEKEYNSYSAWRSACKAAGAKSFEGDKDTCQAKPGVGEWGGDKGVVYKK